MNDVTPEQRQALARILKEKGIPLALTGTHGSGKSTLAARLSQALDLPVRDGAARRAVVQLESWKRDGLGGMSESCAMQQVAMKEVMRPFMDPVEACITCRTPLDVLCYSYAKFGYRPSPGESELLDYQNRLVEHFFCLVEDGQVELCYVPRLAAPVARDGVRPTALAAQEMIALLLQGYMADLGYEVMDVDGGHVNPSPEQRCETVLRDLRSLYL